MTEAVLLIVWFVATVMGGYLLVKAVFRLTPAEDLIVGIAAGISLEIVISSILGQIIKTPASFYLSAGIVFVSGVFFWWKNSLSLPIFSKSQIGISIVFILITTLMFSICRGMGIFDDYAHLPTVSLVAAGDIPPHFALNRNVLYAYHYFLILFAGQITRIGDIFVWSAMDLARSISFSIAVFLAGLWTARVAKNKFVGVLGGLFIAFGSGTRWLLLIMSPTFLESVSTKVTLIGSGASSGLTLLEALLSEWKIEGVGKLPIPFAFTNGIVQPGILSIHGANGLMNIAILLIMLITFNRWRTWQAAIVSTCLLSGLSLVGEADLLLIFGGWIICVVLNLLINKNQKFPRMLWMWGAVIFGGVLLSLFEGGAFVDIMQSWFAPNANTYQSVGFALTWPPSIVSAHLGVLSLTQPDTILTALFEIGPVLLVLPLIVVWGIKVFRNKRWFEGALIIGFFLTIGSILINFEGSTGVRNTSRLYSFLTLVTLYFVPLLWRWASHRSDVVKYSGISLFFISLVSGFVIFASQLTAIQLPVVAPFMTELDAKISQQYWNVLNKKTMVFDPIPYRSVIIFGRAVEAGQTWYEYLPEWKALYELPGSGKDFKKLDTTLFTWMKSIGTAKRSQCRNS